ncbi:ketopantoate reductase C-terminal domain-containing protein [Bradyrhizobium cenepequi]|uniref:ketopantoate reductase C-terminal domain-containing protein n=1 Tax=Bradyrhizobium cenepequi TaxID=2821403 RepID=UPI001CE30099|nr:ketopantoate reductase C-terminal domain-containing protein [Bradyrhizobium cenepequi]MCA6111555.1 hypothetical protein [Bradyrhizobium cenepequi]
MALDLERVNQLERPWLDGKVVELGRELTVATPVHSMTYTLLKPCTIGTSGNDAGSAFDRAYRR